MKNIFVVFVFMFFIQCNHKYEYAESFNLKGKWTKKDTLNFDINIKDLKLRNITFVLRNNNDYPFSNIYLLVKIRQGKRILETDTLNYEVAEKNGEWKGAGIGPVKEINLGYKKGFKFPKSGTYTLSVVHGMRKDTLIGIEDFGINIE